MSQLDKLSRADRGRMTGTESTQGVIRWRSVVENRRASLDLAQQRSEEWEAWLHRNPVEAINRGLRYERARKEILGY